MDAEYPSAAFLFYERYEILISSPVQLLGIGGIRFLVQLTQILVVVLPDLLVVARKDQYTHAGALVGGTFEIGQRFEEDDPCTYGTPTGFQPRRY